ncbi:hypothetical protein E0Z10_g7729 [Xylaria hypoxylon]|uniref:SMODS and SLOG-associating 2TM effector domain-containing protein n=1 Tax=Xylaria hypoxylon TaxID=37992 RepID=A0A4Z0YD57_9PEZI|nr:hypothetical protein E0Z10_g7729 [Xylaria hypoxylon]
MSSFFEAAIRLALRRRPGEGRMTEEYAQSLAGRPPGEEPAAVMPAAVLPSAQAPGADPFAARENRQQAVYINPKEDPLTFFRLMMGIQTTPYLGFTISGPLGTRPAENLGLYARIVHSEQKAKDSFRVFSIVINGCYFLQIVIAAALTALGAARASSGAVTAFGALNTIREFIEQRERDFMRSGHSLDVYEVIETIEKMYNKLKADIELNTPDSYTSLANQQRAGDTKDDKIGGIDMSKLETLASKLKGFDNGKLDSLTAGITKKTEDVTKDIHQHEKQIGEEVEHLKEDVIRDVQSHKARLDREAKDREAQARAAILEGKQTARNGVEEHRAKLDDTVNAVGEQHARALETINDTGRAAQEGIGSATSHATGSFSNLAREIREIHETAISGGRVAAAQQIRSLAHRLAGNDDNPEERKPETGKLEGKPRT